MAKLIKPNVNMGKGFFGIGVDHPKTEENLGTLVRSGKQFGASFIFTIGHRYKKEPSAVNLNSKIPIFNFKDWKEFRSTIPDVEIIGVDLTDVSEDLKVFKHPKSCIYLLGSEDNGLSKLALENCNKFVKIEGNYSLNVAVAGSIIMYERYLTFN